MKNLNIPQYKDHSVNTDNIDKLIVTHFQPMFIQRFSNVFRGYRSGTLAENGLRAKEKFKNHQRVQLIKCYYENKGNTFCFSKLTHIEIVKELNKFGSFKSSPNSNISTKTVKDNIDIFTPILHQEFDISLELGKFPSEMKLADITPVFKKEDRINKENYRPISILSNLSKVFER